MLGVMVVAAGCVVLAAGALFKGAPTAISQRCPGLPCSGFSPAPVTGAVVAGVTVGVTVGVIVGLLITGADFWPFAGKLMDGLAAGCVGLLSNGAPTAISQRCPGLPCSGFNPTELVTTG